MYHMRDFLTYVEHVKRVRKRNYTYTHVQHMLHSPCLTHMISKRYLFVLFILCVTYVILAHEMHI